MNTAIFITFRRKRWCYCDTRRKEILTKFRLRSLKERDYYENMKHMEIICEDVLRFTGYLNELDFCVLPATPACVCEIVINYLRNSEGRGYTIANATELWILCLSFVTRKVTFVVQFLYAFLFITNSRVSLPVYIYYLWVSQLLMELLIRLLEPVHDNIYQHF